ncbi:MAG: hypothetical protein WAN65_13390 [Candidatus Sulfotelmatobacter sp.]
MAAIAICPKHGIPDTCYLKGKKTERHIAFVNLKLHPIHNDCTSVRGRSINYEGKAEMKEVPV